MLKKVFLGALLVVVICACSPGTNVETTADSAPDSAALVQRVTEIYEDVFKDYNLEDSLRNLDLLEGRGVSDHRDAFNRNYCSREWNELLRQISEIDSLYHDGEIGFWEADYWIMAQDWHKLSVSDVKVLVMTTTEAIVEFKLHNFDQANPVTLRLVNEDGVWKIDDFIDVKNDYAWKQSMQEYVKEETELNKKS